jgi:hypothetical protein
MDLGDSQRGLHVVELHAFLSLLRLLFIDDARACPSGADLGSNGS